MKKGRILHALIFTKIVLRRVPIYKKEWAAMTERLIERAAMVLQKSVEV